MEENRETAVIEYEVKLTNADRLKIGQQLGDLDNVEDQIKTSQAAAVAGFKARLADNQAERKQLSMCLRTGLQQRVAECQVVYDYDAGLVKYVELESGQVVKTRDMSKEERQLNLFGGNED